MAGGAYNIYLTGILFKIGSFNHRRERMDEMPAPRLCPVNTT